MPHRRPPARIAPASLALVLVASIARADVIEVPADHPTIQAAIDAAADGDEIVVAPGVYTGAGTAPVVNMQGKAVTLRSSGGATTTILDGELARRVIECTSGEGPATIIDGFTIQLGFNGFDDGPGMANVGSSPTVRHCVFLSNGDRFLTRYGGGMHNQDASPDVTDCLFLGNGAQFAGGGMRNVGGSQPSVTRCEFRNNSAGEGGGMANAAGAAPIVTDCLFHLNSSHDGKLFGGTGGGMSSRDETTPQVTDCVFQSNSTGEAGFGGGMFARSGVFTRCRFEANAAEVGAAADVDGDVELVECVVTDNHATFSGGGLRTVAPGPLLIGTHVCGNTPDQIDGPWLDGGNNLVDAECATCPADIDGNGTVDVQDLLTLLRDWGCMSCPGTDLDGSGTVGTPDLLIVLAAWGACPPPG